MEVSYGHLGKITGRTLLEVVGAHHQLPQKAKRAQLQSISSIWEQNGPLENTSLPPDDRKPMLKIPIGCQNKGLGVPGNLLYRVRAAKPNKTWEKINRRGWVKPRAVPAPSRPAPEVSPAGQDRLGGLGQGGLQAGTWGTRQSYFRESFVGITGSSHPSLICL